MAGHQHYATQYAALYRLARDGQAIARNLQDWPMVAVWREMADEAARGLQAAAHELAQGKAQAAAQLNLLPEDFDRAS